jgi:hypothetical protein
MGSSEYWGTDRLTCVVTPRLVPLLEFAPNPKCDDPNPTHHDYAAVEFVPESSSPLSQLQVPPTLLTKTMAAQMFAEVEPHLQNFGCPE